MWKRESEESFTSTDVQISNVPPHSLYFSSPLTDPVNLREAIEKHNLNSRVRNWKRFRLLKETSLMIVVQVHRDIIALKNLITSLQNARYIEEVLLVFSHSYYNELVNTIVRSIKKFGVLQIYYPYSVQLHENKFPGRDRDCVNNSNKQLSSRNAFKAERKNHWWWTAHYVFDKFDISSDYESPVVFLEEYHYVAPDFIYMLDFMRRTLYFHPKVDVMTFGRPETGAFPNFNRLYLEAWIPSYTWVGLAFNRTFWQRITANALYFCTFNDCDWSYSLYNVIHHYNRGYARMVTCAAQRVFFISGTENLRATQLRLNRTLKHLFPNNVRLSEVCRTEATQAMLAPDTVIRGRGGFDDIRDQMLCYDIMLSDTTTKELIDENKPLYI